MAKGDQKEKRQFSRVSTPNDLNPDEIFLDASNLPKFNTSQLEGRLERPITKTTVYFVAAVGLLVFLVFIGRLHSIQIGDGSHYAALSENNRLKHTTIFSERGIILDRQGTILARNAKNEGEPAFLKRTYIDLPGLGHILGYVSYPKKDRSGAYYERDIRGMDGVEKAYNDELAGGNGIKIIETNALGDIQSESLFEPPRNGDNLTLSIDARLQPKLFELIKNTAETFGFSGGGAVFMDAENGEIIAMTSYPEFNSNVMTIGKDSATIRSYGADKRNPFLNRITDGLYTPGSIVKPFIAIAALNEKVITPEKKILSTGSISVPNPFDSTKKTVFRDWRPQGLVDIRQAIAVSSDVYFYEIGGGFENQAGLGINNIEKYLKMFGFGQSFDDPYLSGEPGIIPNPAWKAENFSGEIWRIGDTYNSSIGQYGFQVTPIQSVRAIAAVANGGKLLTPTVVRKTNFQIEPPQIIPATASEWRVVREGMRKAVEEGTAKGLDLSQVEVAAKTGTAELGTIKKYVNSWVIGFFPYKNPRYAFAAIMERGPYENTIGALYVIRQFLEWLAINTPEYLK
jgi:penicillin-binding protein 2